MTANHAHTPTREEFKSLLNQIVGAVGMNFVAHQQALDEFDRMIAQVEAAAEQRGAEKVRQAVQELPEMPDNTEARYGYNLALKRAKEAATDRADRMEGDDEV